MTANTTNITISELLIVSCDCDMRRSDDFLFKLGCSKKEKYNEFSVLCLILLCMYDTSTIIHVVMFCIIKKLVNYCYELSSNCENYT